MSEKNVYIKGVAMQPFERDVKLTIPNDNPTFEEIIKANHNTFRILFGVHSVVFLEKVEVSNFAEDIRLAQDVKKLEVLKKLRVLYPKYPVNYKIKRQDIDTDEYGDDIETYAKVDMFIYHNDSGDNDYDSDHIIDIRNNEYIIYGNGSLLDAIHDRFVEILNELVNK